MALTQADLDALKRAYASGVLTVRYSDGKEVRYPSGADLLARIRVVEAEIAGQSAATRRPIAGVGTFRRT